MKKLFSILTVAAVAVSCSKSGDDVAATGANDVISFAPSISLSASTRSLIGANQLDGATSTEKLQTLAPSAEGGTFHIVAYTANSTADADLYLAANLDDWSGSLNPLFQLATAGGNGDKVSSGAGLVGGTTINAAANQILYLWPIAKDQKLDFYAYFAKEGATNVNAQGTSQTLYDYTMGATPAAQCDVLISDKSSYAKSDGKAVDVKFRHAMSMVQFVFASTVKTGMQLQKVVINDYTAGTFDITKDVDYTAATGVIATTTSPKADITNDFTDLSALTYSDGKASTYTAAAKAGTLLTSGGAGIGSSVTLANYTTNLANTSTLIFPDAAAKTATLTFGAGTNSVMEQDVTLSAPAADGAFFPGKVYQYVIKYDGKVVEISEPVVVDWVVVDGGEIEL